MHADRDLRTAWRTLPERQPRAARRYPVAVGSGRASPLSAGADSGSPDCARDAGRLIWFVGVARRVYVSTPASTGAKLPPLGMIPRNRSISLPNSPFSA